ncbi:hypothetical protein IWQ62_004841 [Dispira parvispora]|uniref:DUF962 domain-containing protein n=1 Tax=Dispira parvispora TaxID=1520584 RepID=A0A9W8E520_9FUNG|nr:hypothetical protein IWQ62_004841 [Dispira parvispora]
MSIFNLKEQFAFYGAYHHDHRNVVVHVIFVPAIMWSAFVIAALYGPFALPEDWQNSVWFQRLGELGLQVNLTLLASLVYTAYYMVLDFTAALLYLPFLGFACSTATVLAERSPHALGIAIGVQVTSWLAQFYSHAVYEKRAPALLDNVAQALLMAPFFVFLEVIFRCGYRPKLYTELNEAVRAKIRQFPSSSSAADVKAHSQ